jgi:hypothetical protein
LINEVDSMDKPLIGITEAASILGIAQTTLAAGLIQQLYPFGNATKGKRGSYRYIIIQSRFEKYMAGADMLEHANYSEEGKSNEADDETLMPVVKAAKIMGIVPTTLEGGLQQNLYPFGNATRTNVDDGKRHGSYWRYIVFKKRFEKFISAGDMKSPDGWQQIQHCAVFKSKDNPDDPPIILFQRELGSDIDDEIDLNINADNLFNKMQKEYLEEQIRKDLALPENKRLNRYCENSGLYYSLSEIYKIIGIEAYSLPDYCKRGVIKGMNPVGNKWFIEIESFDYMDSTWMSKRSQNRFNKYLREKQSK